MYNAWAQNRGRNDTSLQRHPAQTASINIVLTQTIWYILQEKKWQNRINMAKLKSIKISDEYLSEIKIDGGHYTPTIKMNYHHTKSKTKKWH